MRPATVDQRARLRVIEATLSTEAGVPVEVTIRGPRSFTWAFEGRNRGAAERLADIARRQGSTAEIDETDINRARDLGDEPMWHTAVYVEAPTV